MVLSSPNPLKVEKIRDDIELIPIIDLLSDRSEVSKLIVKACEEIGFFKVINHGVPHQIISRIEEEANEFFSKPGSDKKRVSPANPDSVNGYVTAVRELACEILDLMAEGLQLTQRQSSDVSPRLSCLIKDSADQTDSVLRMNHYPPADVDDASSSTPKIGFGEHTDPQLLTLLRSNDADGLQISVHDGVWVPVDPHPTSAFCVNVGDLLQVLTNWRFLSVRHRVVVKSYKSRTSIGYFAAPPLNAIIRCLATPENPPLYRSFTWAEYKTAAYDKRLGDTRLNMFKLQSDDNHGDGND